MSRRSEEYLSGIPTKPYDLLREGLIVLCFLAVVIILLAVFLSSPDYPAVRGEDVARLQPIAYLRTSAGILAGNSEIQTYGPPYTSDNANSQHLFGAAPATWFGVTIPIDPAHDFVLKPLARVAVLDRDVAGALQVYTSSTPFRQQAWSKAYLSALDRATVANGRIELPEGDYGPVAVLMQGMLNLGRAGLLEGALESSARLPYILDFTRSLLFFQGDVFHGVARSLDMLGEQWGISHETGRYPGAWWLWPYTFLYQIPPMSSSPNGDLQAGFIMLIVFLVLFFMPFLPILNRLPIWLGVHRVIWRDRRES